MTGRKQPSNFLPASKPPRISTNHNKRRTRKTAALPIEPASPPHVVKKPRVDTVDNVNNYPLAPNAHIAPHVPLLMSGPPPPTVPVYVSEDAEDAYDTSDTRDTCDTCIDYDDYVRTETISVPAAVQPRGLPCDFGMTDIYKKHYEHMKLRAEDLLCQAEHFKQVVLYLPTLPTDLRRLIAQYVPDFSHPDGVWVSKLGSNICYHFHQPVQTWVRPVTILTDDGRIETGTPSQKFPKVIIRGHPSTTISYSHVAPPQLK